MKRRRAVPPLQVFCAGAALWLWPGLAEARQIRELPSTESIASYEVAIDVQEDGWLDVTETIRVRALGEEVRWGIDRDLPIGPRREHGLGRVTAPFEVVDVRRDGGPQSYVIRDVGGFSGSSGVRVRMGNPERRISPGEHVYSLSYRTTRWLDFDGDRVRLRWDVTGHRWPVPITSAAARVHLPGRVAEDAVSLGGWTGGHGSRDENLVMSFEPAADSGSIAAFRTTKPLRRAEGLAIDLTFPATLVSPPTAEQRAEWSHLDWKPYADMAPILVVVFGFYLVGWAVVGRDPPGRPVVVRYDAPEGLSPAAVGYLDARGYDARQLTATMMSLARKGVLEIEVKGRRWTLRRIGPIPETLTPDERGVVEKLLPDRDALVILGISHRRIGEARRALRSELRRRFRTRYFVTNRFWIVMGGLLSLIGIAALVTRARFGFESSIWTLSLGLFVGSIITARLLTRGFRRWRTDLAEMSPRPSLLVASVFPLLATVPLGVLGVMTRELYQIVPPYLVVAVVLLSCVNAVFYQLMERPTVAGREILDQVDGFKRFLSATEEDRIERLSSKEAEALYERLLPYAIALGMKNRRAANFGDAIGSVMLVDRR